MPTVDVLVFAPHPDDAELCCGGLLLKAKHAGLRTGVIDFTRGELGTRGSIAMRKREAAAATRLLQLDARENLGLPDCRLREDERLCTAMVAVLRKYRPSMLLTPHWKDQHPDHEAVGRASIHAAFLAGVPKYHARSAGNVAANGRLPYRPRTILHYNNRYGIRADIVVDITDVLEKKFELLACYPSQFGPGKKGDREAQTRLSNSAFLDWLRSMHAYYGFQAGVQYGEAYRTRTPLAVKQIGLFVEKK